MDEVFQEITKGHPAAFNVCVTLERFAHMLDDLIDQDNEACTREHALRVALEFFVMLGHNPFWRDNSHLLCPIIEEAIADWADSMEWQESADCGKRLDADVLKGRWHNIYYKIARIVGGYEHAREMSRKYRSYDHEGRN